ncbi:MAG: hypothetical protein ABIN20_00540 [candidate division WOR-3 bacterium]
MFNFTLFLIFSVNPVKGAIFSLLIPGLGEKIYGNDREFIILFTGEISLLSFYFYDFKTKKEIREDYKIFAFNKAFAYAGTDDENYWNAVENYYNYDIYYEYLLREARALYPDNPLIWEEYARENSVPYRWAWKDTTSWDEFLHRRERERKIESRMKLFQGFIISYHIFSAIYTFIHLKLKEKNKFELKGEFEPEKDKVSIKLIYRF